MGQLNRNNFITWYHATDGTTPIRAFVGNKIHDGFIVWPLGEIMSIWVNIPELQRIIDYRCVLVSNNNTVEVEAFPILTLLNYGDDWAYPYGEMALPTDIASGFYQLRLEMIDAEGEPVAQMGLSNQIYICSLAKAKTISNLFRFRNRFSMHGIQYAHVEEFYQRMYLPFGVTQAKPEQEQTIHKDERSGRVSLLNVKTEMVHELVSLPAGKWFHDAGTLLSRHDAIQINGSEYVGRGVYNNEPIGKDGLWSARMDVVELAQSTVQLCS